MSDIVERLGQFATCEISDGMNRLRLPRTSVGGITPLHPRRRIAGPAFTVAFVEIDEQLPTPDNYLGDAQPGDVVVLAAGGHLDFSVWGGKRSWDAVQQDVAGVVVDGCYRDLDEQHELDLSIYGRGHTPVGLTARLRPSQTNVPVVFGGVEVNPGDYVVADDNGVIIVPRDQAEEVIAAAEARIAEEQEYKRQALAARESKA